MIATLGARWAGLCEGWVLATKNPRNRLAMRTQTAKVAKMLQSQKAVGERVFIGPPAAGGLVDGTIWYLLVVPGDDDQQTPFQAFSRGLTEVSIFLRSLAWLPASVFEFGLSWAQRIEFMQTGILSYHVVPMNVAHLRPLDVAEHSPFCVVFSSLKTDAAVSAWIESCTVKPLHVTASSTGGDITEGAIDEKSLRSFARARLEVLAESAQFAVMAQAMLEQMKEPPSRTTLPFPSTSHNTCEPNELVLYRVGREFSGDVRLDPGQGDGPVLDAIVRETSEILSLRTPQGTTPTMILATTGRSRLMEQRLLEQARNAPKDTARTLAAAVRDLRNQTGYFVASESEVFKLPEYVPTLLQRAIELRTFTDALAVRAMSELSAFVRMPPAVDRVWGTLRKVADCYRGSSDKRTSKLARLMMRFRAELMASVPQQLQPLIERGPTDIRIVSDLPLEWTPMNNGESLLFRHTCSRIPTVPGNIFYQTALPKPRIHFSAETLTKVLIIRSLDESDPVRKITEVPLAVLEKREGTTVSIVDVDCLQGLVDALNGFDGGIVVFDMHGRKSPEASGICIGGKLFDPWVLRGIARMPPIAFPLSCDTLPMDTLHSSAAVALLAAGARTVVGTLLPIDARKSSVFLARLVRAIHTFLPILRQMGISRVIWSELFSVIQRSQLIHETAMRLFEPRWRLDRDAVTHSTSVASSRVFERDPEWYAHFVREFADLLQLSADDFKKWMRTEMPLPDCELFVQVGEPESVVVHLRDPDWGDPLVEQGGEDTESPLWSCTKGPPLGT